VSRAIQTDGIGVRTDKHLNLTRTLADAWQLSPAEVAEVRRSIFPRPAPKPVPEPPKVPYAGREAKGKAFVRLRAPEGNGWLHMSGVGMTLIKADSWVGTPQQLDRLRVIYPETRNLAASDA
jgi:hypothetical protein